MSTYELSDLRSLLSLQQLDTKIAEWQAALELASSAVELEPLRAELAAAAAARDELQHRVQAIRRDLRYQEQEVEKIRAEATAQERKLYGGAIRNPKEAQQMEQHIAALRRRSAEGEDKAVSLMLELEGLDTELTDAVRVAETQAARLTEAEAALAVRREALEGDLPELREQREAAAKSIPGALLRIYETTKTRRGGIAVAAVSNGKCTVCRMMVPFMTVRAIRQAELKTCDSCSRIVVEA